MCVHVCVFTGGRGGSVVDTCSAYVWHRAAGGEALQGLATVSVTHTHTHTHTHKRGWHMTYAGRSWVGKVTYRRRGWAVLLCLCVQTIVQCGVEAGHWLRYVRIVRTHSVLHDQGKAALLGMYWCCSLGAF